MTAVVVPGCSQPGSLQGAAPSPLPLPAGITVAFNHRAEAHYRSPISGAQRSGDDLEALLLETIRGAQRELLVAVQELSLPQVARALVEQHRRGLRVQVVLENTYSQPWSSQHEAELSPHLRQRRRQLMALADRNRDGQLTAKEREQGDAVALLQRGGVPLLDDTADGSRG
ncbi:MAG: phospholipase, partial [Vulcanococcus sp.]